MSREPFQVLIVPFRQTDLVVEYAALRRSDMDCWQAFAGGGEAAETPAAAARREATEEGAIPNGAALYALDARASVPRKHFRAAAGWASDIFVVTEHSFAIDCTDVEVVLSEEHREVRWGSYEAIDALLQWDSNRTALWELDERIRTGFLARCHVG